MAANWNNPTLTSLYVDFLAELKARDVDVLTMNPGTNIPVDSKRWNVATNTFQTWTGSAWVNLVLAGAGGGTGGTTPVSLGTMATQNSNAVAITGGTITGVNLNANDITSGVLALSRGGTGTSLALGPGGSFLISDGISGLAFTFVGSNLNSLNASNITLGNLAMARMPTGGTWSFSNFVEITQPDYIRMLSGGFIVGGIGNMGSGTINAQAYFINGVPFTPGGGGTVIPAGMMMIKQSPPCPAGWSRVNDADFRVIRFTPNGGGLGSAGGAETHQHFVAQINTGLSPLDTGIHNPVGNSRSFDSGSSFSGFLLGSGAGHVHTMEHSHLVPGQNSDSASSWPPYLDMVLCVKD